MLYQLSIGDSDATMPACGSNTLAVTGREAARYVARTDAAELPLRLGLVLLRASGVLPLDESSTNVPTSLDAVQALATDAAGSTGSREQPRGDGLLMVRDRRTVHLLRLPATGALPPARSIDLRHLGSANATTSLVYRAERRAGSPEEFAITAAAAFTEHFLRMRTAAVAAADPASRHCYDIAVGGAAPSPYCTVRSTSLMSGATADELSCPRCRRRRRRCSGSLSPCAVRDERRRRHHHLRFVALPEVGPFSAVAADAGALSAVPPSRCGDAADDLSFNSNWYWPRADAAGAFLWCEARKVDTHSLAARAEELEVRFRRPPAFTPQLQGALVAPSAHDPCELLLQLPMLSGLHSACVENQHAALDARSRAPSRATPTRRK